MLYVFFCNWHFSSSCDSFTLLNLARDYLFHCCVVFYCMTTPIFIGFLVGGLFSKFYLYHNAMNTLTFNVILLSGSTVAFNTLNLSVFTCQNWHRKLCETDNWTTQFMFEWKHVSVDFMRSSMEYWRLTEHWFGS